MSDSRNVTHSDLEGPYVNTQTENRQGKKNRYFDQ